MEFKETKKEVSQQIEELQNKIDTQITELESRVSDLQGDAKSNLEKKIEDLKSQKDILTAKSEAVASTTEAEWDKFKVDLTKTMNNVDDKLDSLKSKMQEIVNS